MIPEHIVVPLLATLGLIALSTFLAFALAERKQTFTRTVTCLQLTQVAFILSQVTPAIIVGMLSSSWIAFVFMLLASEVFFWSLFYILRQDHNKKCDDEQFLRKSGYEGTFRPS